MNMHAASGGRGAAAHAMMKQITWMAQEITGHLLPTDHVLSVLRFDGILTVRVNFTSEDRPNERLDVYRPVGPQVRACGNRGAVLRAGLICPGPSATQFGHAGQGRAAPRSENGPRAVTGRCAH